MDPKLVEAATLVYREFFLRVHCLVVFGAPFGKQRQRQLPASPKLKQQRSARQSLKGLVNWPTPCSISRTVGGSRRSSLL